MRTLKSIISFILPRALYARLISIYHLSLAYLGAILYRAPSRGISVIGVTGTKGKSSTTEFINAIFEEASYSTALLNSIRVKVGDESGPNTNGRSMPGRFFIQRLLSRAVEESCDIAILEMTSEGARQYRHRAIELDAFVFTNLAPEHIESHGSLQAYADAKFSLGTALVRSKKRPRIMVANGDDPESARYLALAIEKSIPFSLSKQTPWEAGEHGGHFTFDGVEIHVNLPGEFSLKNALAAAETARAFEIDTAVIKRGVERLRRIPGRAEEIQEGQDFTVVVDYAHTPDSLEAIYKAYEGRRKICVLGSMGGGRDSWNRPVKGKLASQYCEEVILTDEDPCDDDPLAIIRQIQDGVTGKEARIIPDRREAIRKALSLAHPGDAVLITGKGTDRYIYGPRGTKTPWSDAEVAREEIRKLSERGVSQEV